MYEYRQDDIASVYINTIGQDMGENCVAGGKFPACEFSALNSGWE
jgi:hypothetical protein